LQIREQTGNFQPLVLGITVPLRLLGRADEVIE
jgi:hypothetical protein